MVVHVCSQRVRFQAIDLKANAVRGRRAAIFPCAYPVAIHRVFRCPVDPVRVSNSVHFVVRARLMGDEDHGNNHQCVAQLIQCS